VRAGRLRIDAHCYVCGESANQVDHLDGTDYEDDSGRGNSWLNIYMTYT
jgi:hypothetical protein